MFIASLLFGISASLDALLVGLSYGIRRVRIRPWQNLVISLITLLGTCVSVAFGHRLTTLLPKFAAHYGGSLILICLGLYYLLKWFAAFPKSRRAKAPAASDFQSCTIKAEENTQKCTAAAISDFHSCAVKTASDSKPPSGLTLPEVFTLSLTLSLNNLGLGLSASLGGLSLASAAISTFACSVLFLSAGNRLGGSSLLQFIRQATDPLSGLLLIGLGVLQLALF